MSSEPKPREICQPTIHKAETASGPSGAVEWWDELTEAEAIERRRQGLDVVVRGSDWKANRRLARQIEAAVGGPFSEDRPHTRAAGPLALPHFNQNSRSPSGHTFFESTRTKAKKR